jgi:hypothetical protein
MRSKQTPRCVISANSAAETSVVFYTELLWGPRKGGVDELAALAQFMKRRVQAAQIVSR